MHSAATIALAQVVSNLVSCPGDYLAIAWLSLSSECSPSETPPKMCQPLAPHQAKLAGTSCEALGTNMDDSVELDTDNHACSTLSIYVLSAHSISTCWYVSQFLISELHAWSHSYPQAHLRLCPSKLVATTRILDLVDQGFRANKRSPLQGSLRVCHLRRTSLYLPTAT